MHALAAALQRPVAKGLTKEQKALMAKTTIELRALLQYLGVQGYEKNEDKSALVRAIIDHRNTLKTIKMNAAVTDVKARCRRDSVEIHSR